MAEMVAQVAGAIVRGVADRGAASDCRPPPWRRR